MQKWIPVGTKDCKLTTCAKPVGDEDKVAPEPQNIDNASHGDEENQTLKEKINIYVAANCLGFRV
jgi:hypothetical protein